MTELTKKLEEIKAGGEGASANEILNTLMGHKMIVPAQLPKDIAPELLKKIVSATGEQPIPAGVNLQPAVLRTRDGENYLTVFTSEEELEKRPKDFLFPVNLNLQFDDIKNMMDKEEQLRGMIINPFSTNISMTKNKNEKKPLTPEQIHQMIRQKIESHELPQAFFREKKGMIDRLNENAVETLLSFYLKEYHQPEHCPYEEDDFDCMTLNIRDDLTICKVSMPEKMSFPGTCPMVFAVYNPQEDQIRYLAILRVTPDAPALLMEAFEDGKTAQIGEAPEEGNEFNAIIELV